MKAKFNTNKLIHFVSIVILGVLLTACNQLIIHHKTKRIKRGKNYCHECLQEKRDQAECVFENNQLVAYGKSKESNRLGVWYFYDSTCAVSSIVRYKSNQKDTVLVYRRVLINESW